MSENIFFEKNGYFKFIKSKNHPFWNLINEIEIYSLLNSRFIKNPNPSFTEDEYGFLNTSDCRILNYYYSKSGDCFFSSTTSQIVVINHYSKKGIFKFI